MSRPRRPRFRRSVSEDLYIVMPAFDLKDQTASFQIVINPLVNWIWVGFGIMALGTGIALLPERALEFAIARLPAGAAATTPLVLLLLLLLPVSIAAQHVESAQTVMTVPRSETEKELYRSLICMCGTCGRQLVGVCACGYAAQMREEISNLVNQGKTKEDVIQYYIAKYGSQEPLAAPIDKGFNRLAWFLPYLVGVGGAVAVGLVAIRWSRRPARAAVNSTRELDGELETRLDDELRNLD